MTHMTKQREQEPVPCGTPVDRPVGRLAPERARTCEQGCNGCDDCDDCTDYEDDSECSRCHGDGMDPWCDYCMPCPQCGGRDAP